MSKISPKNIAEAIYEASEGKSGRELELVLKRGAEVLARKRMLGKSTDILKALQDIVDRKTGTVRVKVSTAKKISDAERKKIEHEVRERYKAKKVVSEFFEKSELLGGMRIEVGDEVRDDTYKNRLNQLEKFLIRSN